ncbi:MAG TPA: Gfo/Idh/MocA family oxidoreductase, partial [Spirochaetia bacterium]|nr:Gfo/Idh/MocA family oxidoreductase [Spirochaetia bacterium]
PWRERLNERYPSALVTDDLAEVLADPGVELVSIATRSIDHYDHAMRALAAGKIVFLEKPMCTTLDQAVSLRDASDQGPGTLFVRHNRRFEPGFQEVRSIIDSGILGDIIEIKLARTSFGRRNDWQTLLEYGGGQLSNWGSHIIDHALQFLGAPDAPLASIHTWLARVAAVGDAEDHVKIVLTGQSGAVVDVEVSGGAATPTHEYVVWGTRGGLYGSGDRLNLRYLDPNVELAARSAFAGVPGSEFAQPSGKLALGNRTIGSNFGQPEDLPWIEEERRVPAGEPSEIWDHLYATIRNGVPFPVTLDEAVEVMRVIDTARQGSPFVQASVSV